MDENEALSEAVQPTRRRRRSKEFKETVIRAVTRQRSLKLAVIHIFLPFFVN